MSTEVLELAKHEVITPQLVGQPLKRKEDPRFITGVAKFIDDIKLPRMLYGAVFRSPYAHAKLTRVDVTKARHSPGVELVLTANDLPKNSLSASFMELPLPGLEVKERIEKPILAKDEATYAGEPIAFVVADTRHHAEDALELIDAEYERLPVVVDEEEALTEHSPKVHSTLKSNLAIVYRIKGGAEDIEKVFSRAAKVVKREFTNQRLSPSPMEPRGVLASYDAGSLVLTLWLATQGPFQARSLLSYLLSIPENRIRIIVPDVGGAFGAKSSPYPEDLLACISSIMLSMPVKWIESRSENFQTMTQGRGQKQYVEIATNERGRILGLKVKVISDSGAYPSALPDAFFTVQISPGPYVVPAFFGEMQMAMTNKVPHDAYRGAGKAGSYLPD